MSEENVSVLRRGYEAFNRGDLDGALQAMHPDIEWFGEFLPEQEGSGVAGLRRLWRQWLDTFDDFSFEIDELIDLGDHVVVTAAIAGRGRVSGAGVRTPTAHVWTLRDGKAVRLEMFQTRAEALAAAGAAS